LPRLFRLFPLWLLRNQGRTVKACTTLMAKNPLGFVFPLTFRAN